MNLRTRLRRALCRHDWLAVFHTGRYDRKCRKCGVMERVAR